MLESQPHGVNPSFEASQGGEGRRPDPEAELVLYIVTAEDEDALRRAAERLQRPYRARGAHAAPTPEALAQASEYADMAERVAALEIEDDRTNHLPLTREQIARLKSARGYPTRLELAVRACTDAVKLFRKR